MDLGDNAIEAARNLSRATLEEKDSMCSRGGPVGEITGEPERTRYEIRVELGLKDGVTAEVFALVVFLL